MSGEFCCYPVCIVPTDLSVVKITLLDVHELVRILSLLVNGPSVLTAADITV